MAENISDNNIETGVITLVTATQLNSNSQRVDFNGTICVSYYFDLKTMNEKNIIFLRMFSIIILKQKELTSVLIFQSDKIANSCEGKRIRKDF